MTDAARAWACAALVAAAVLALDQATKALVRHGLALGDEDPVLPAVKLVHTRNSGVAFGTFAGSTVVSVLVVLALAALLAYFATHATKPLVWLPTGMLLGGAIGNIVDLLIRIIVVETGGHRFAFEVSPWIAPVQTQISHARIRDFIQVRGHDREMLGRRSIDIHKNRAMLSQKIDCRS